MSDQQKAENGSGREVPEGWERKRFGDVISKSQYGITATASDSGKYPMFKMNNFQNGKMNPENVDLIDISESDLEKYRLQDGDILFNRTNSIDLVGKTGKFDLQGEYVFASYLVRFKVKEGVCTSDYLNFYMNWDSSKAKLREIATKGVSQANINPTTLSNFFEVLLPPLPEQIKIASILFEWDDSLSVLAKLIEAKRQQKRGLAEQLLTGKKRLPGFQGEWEESSLEMLAEDKKVALGRGDVISKKDIEEVPGDYPIYSSSIKKNGLFGKYGKYMFDEEMITWSIDGGGDFFHRQKHKFSVTNVSGYMRVNQIFLNYYWLYSTLSYLHSFEQFDYQKKAHPSVILKLYKFLLPPLPEQEAIASVLSTLDAEISALSSLKTSLLAQKRGLMDVLLTGRVRVQV